MPLSCDCDNNGDYEWIWISPRNFSTLWTDTRKKCQSCNTLIEIGADCLEFEREEWDEEKEEDVPMDSHFMCEECGGLYFALEDLGYCIPVDENMRDLVKEYNDDYQI